MNSSVPGRARKTYLRLRQRLAERLEALAAVAMARLLVLEAVAREATEHLADYWPFLLQLSPTVAPFHRTEAMEAWEGLAAPAALEIPEEAAVVALVVEAAAELFGWSTTRCRIVERFKQTVARAALME